MKLHLYFASRFLKSFGSVFGIFAIILFLLNMMDQISVLSGTETGLRDVLILTALNAPSLLYRIFPLVMVIAALVMFLNLSRTSELVVVRAAGRSAIKATMSPIVTGFLVGCLALAILNPIVASTLRAYESRLTGYKDGAVSTLSVSEEGLWLRQGNRAEQVVIHAKQANLDGTRLIDVTFMTFTQDDGIIRRITATSADLENGAWTIKSAKDWDIAASENPEQTAITHDEMTLASDLTADQIRDSFGTPSAIAIWDLPAFIKQMDNAGFSAKSHRVWLNMELSLPIMMVAMILIAAVFTMRHSRAGQTGQMVLYALMCGFGLYFVRNFAQILGEKGQIPIEVAAWSPPFAAIFLALAYLLHLEDG